MAAVAGSASRTVFAMLSVVGVMLASLGQRTPFTAQVAVRRRLEAFPQTADSVGYTGCEDEGYDERLHNNESVEQNPYLHDSGGNKPCDERGVEGCCDGPAPR